VKISTLIKVPKAMPRITIYPQDKGLGWSKTENGSIFRRQKLIQVTSSKIVVFIIELF
jgi:hypothetical protein